MPSKKTSFPQYLEIGNSFDYLYYQGNNTWIPLPGWGRFYMKLGAYLSQYDDSKSRFVAALAVPTRSFASTFIAAGITCGRAWIPSDETDHEYYEKILSLEEGTPLIYRDKNRKKNAKKKENKLYNGKFHIGIQVDEGITNTIKYISPENARQIEISDKEYLKLPHQQKGKEIPPPSKLVSDILGYPQTYNFVLQTRIECVMIGLVNLVKQELKTNLAFSQTNTVFSPGYLADLLRVREFQPPGIAYRSSILPAASKRNSMGDNEVSPFAIIFDGALGFVKWKEYWRQCNWIIILDHTDPNFQYSVAQVNQEYLYRSEKPHRLKIPSLPAGVEMMFFTIDL